MKIEMKRTLVLFTLLFFSFSMLCAVPGPDFPKRGHKNFHGKRMMEEDVDFRLLFIKATKLNDFYNFGLVFSQPVNPESINTENFILNGKVIPLENIRFSKNYRTVDFFVDEKTVLWTDANMDLVIKDVESIRGNIIEPVVINNFKFENDYKLIKKLEK